MKLRRKIIAAASWSGAPYARPSAFTTWFRAWSRGGAGDDWMFPTGFGALGVIGAGALLGNLYMLLS